MADTSNQANTNGIKMEEEEEEVRSSDSPSEFDEDEAYGELITGLRRPGEPAYMEDYLRDRELPNALDDPYFNIKKYKQRPEDYFNFDFKYADYEVFFAKQILMRMEKALIKEAIYKKPEAPK